MFELKGKFKNFNQGELYVYNLEGKAKIDTIRLSEGKFSYLIPLEDTVSLSVVFPNFSEIPLIASPGTTLKMEGDASHLREVSVEGNDDNKLLTKFRLHANELTPPEAVKAAADFIREHPASPACTYLIRKYYLLKAKANWDEAYKLLTVMAEATPDNKRLGQLKQQVAELRGKKQGGTLPRFSALTTAKRAVTNGDLEKELNVISVWATWNYESQNMQRQLRKYQKQYGSRLGLLSICLDGNPAECKRAAERDSIHWSTVCDGLMWDTPLLAQLGIYTIADNILTDSKGHIIARGLSYADLTKKIEETFRPKAK